jgi:hypothetical protein
MSISTGNRTEGTCNFAGRAVIAPYGQYNQMFFLHRGHRVRSVKRTVVIRVLLYPPPPRHHQHYQVRSHREQSIHLHIWMVIH